MTRWGPGAAILAALLAGCPGGGGGGDAPRVLVYARGQDSVKLDPADITDGESAKVTACIFDTLVRFQSESTEVEPSLATSWETSEDGLSWTFHLREGVRFHDDTGLDAEAVVWSFRRQMDPAHPARAPEATFQYWADMFGDVVQVEALDPRTVRFTLSRPSAPFLANLAMFSAAVASPRAWEVHGAAGFATHPVGTGPFRFVEWRPGERIALEGFAGHWEGPPRADRLVFKPVSDNRVRLELLRKGDVDIMDGLDPVDLAGVRQDAGLRVVEQPGMNVAYLAFNNQRPPLDDPRVRRALAHCIDKASIVENLYFDTAVPAVNPMPPIVWGHADDLEDRRLDLDEALRLLDEVLPGRPALTLDVMSNARPYMPEPPKLAIYLQRQFEKVGVRCEVREHDWPSFLQLTENGEHQLCLMGWIGDNGDPDNFLHVLLDASNARKGTASNVSFYTGEEVHRLLDEARGLRDERARAALYQDAQRLIHRDCPMVPLVHATQVVVVRKGVEGLRLHPTGQTRFKDVYTVP
ncbi:MAG: ABC transporter substrate-binding protein [Planctomycetes bacterium]|nr:ABC transporter substrate-binding protein [Planctomycetota bacterium]